MKEYPSDRGLRQTVVMEMIDIASHALSKADSSTALDYSRRALAVSDEMLKRDPTDPELLYLASLARISVARSLLPGKPQESGDFAGKALQIRTELLATDPANAAMQERVA